MSTHRVQRRLPDLTSRRWRRLLVLSLYTGQLVMAALLWDAKEFGPRTREVLGPFAPVLDVLFPAAMAIALGSMLMLFVTTQQVGVLADKEADERQKMVRDRAHRIAYRVVIIVLAIIQLGVTAVAWDNNRAHSPLLVDGSDLTMVLTALLVNIMYLPTVVLAWTEPD